MLLNGEHESLLLITLSMEIITASPEVQGFSNFQHRIFFFNSCYLKRQYGSNINPATSGFLLSAPFPSSQLQVSLETRALGTNVRGTALGGRGFHPYLANIQGHLLYVIDIL